MQRERVAHRVQKVHAVARAEVVEPGDRRRDRQRAGGDDERVVLEIPPRPSSAVPSVTRWPLGVDLAGDGVEPQRHAGGFEVRDGSVREVVPVGDLAARRSRGCRRSRSSGTRRRGRRSTRRSGQARGRAARRWMPASLPPIATSRIGAGRQQVERRRCHSRRSVFEDLAGVLAQAFAGALVGERQDVAADRDVVVVVEDPVGAAADHLRRAGLAELLDQRREQLRQSPAVRGRDRVGSRRSCPSTSSRTRSSIMSRISRTSSSGRPAGSGMSQSSTVVGT